MMQVQNVEDWRRGPVSQTPIIAQVAPMGQIYNPYAQSNPYSVPAMQPAPTARSWAPTPGAVTTPSPPPQDYEERGQPSARAPSAAPAPAPIKYAEPPQSRNSMFGLYAGLCLIALVVIPTLGLASYAVDRINRTFLPGTSATGSVTATPAPKSSAYTYDNPNRDWDGTCQSGKEQSPIDLKGASDATSSLPKISLASFQDVGDLVKNKFSATAKAYNAGHAMQADSFQSFFNWKDETYKLVQFHFHTGSEHTVDGKQTAAEVHFVHQSLDGKYLVIGVMIEEGETSADFLKTIASNAKEDTTPVTIPLEFSKVLKDIGIGAASTPYWAYAGSFTTPPCTEGVQWIVLQKRITMAKADVSALEKAQHINFRPPQPLNSRTLQGANS